MSTPNYAYVLLDELACKRVELFMIESDSQYLNPSLPAHEYLRRLKEIEDLVQEIDLLVKLINRALDPARQNDGRRMSIRGRFNRSKNK